MKNLRYAESRYGIKSAGVERMAPEKPLYAHYRALYRAIPLNRFNRIGGTAGIKPAGISGESRRKNLLVQSENTEQNFTHD